MKKHLSIILALLVIILCFAPCTALASNNEDNIIISDEEFDLLEHVEGSYIETRTTGLIVDKKLVIAKSGSNLVISGYTICTSSVVKCGFTKVVIQRKKSSETSWTNYKIYNDLFSDSNTYNFSKSVAVTSGYQYRVTATHYAKKSLLSTQKIDVTTGYLTF